MKEAARRAVVLAAALLPAPAVLALRFIDGPPPRVTGGFGEDSCSACHFGNAEDDGVGRLTLEGFPERFEPGASHELELALERPGMKAAGFQLAVRLPDGKTQAGRIEAPEADQASTGLLEERGVQFAQHRSSEVPPDGTSAVRWRAIWIAPEIAGPVTLHAAAVAGDGDGSQGGDFVYTLELVASSVLLTSDGASCTSSPSSP